MASKHILEGTYIVLDFETVTPSGRPPEPIELAALRIIPVLRTDPSFSFNTLIRPPKDVPLTPFDTAQTGIQNADIRNAPSCEDVLTRFDEVFAQPVVCVAQNARYEAAIVRRFAKHCPRAAKMQFIDTVALAKSVIPGLFNYKLDTLAIRLDVPIPSMRHRALPDVEMTLSVFVKLLTLAASERSITTVFELGQIAGVELGSRSAEPVARQGSLF